MQRERAAHGPRAAKNRSRAFFRPWRASRKIDEYLFKEIAMAVQQNKKSPSKRGMHRSADFLKNPPLAVEPTTGETHLRHHISPTGFYRGKKIFKTKAD
jgi:large subunit ribosomal protein L32